MIFFNPFILIKKPAFRLIFLLGCFLAGSGFFAPEVKAQGKPRVIQLTGIIAAGDSLYGVPGVNISVPKAGRGTATNAYGYFSLPVLGGDSVVISAIGFQKQTLIIPRTYTTQSYSVIIELEEDITVLPEVRVMPWSTEREFKQAFVALQLPDEQKSAAEKNLDAQLLEKIFAATPMSPQANFRNFINVQQQTIDRTNTVVTNPLLDPFKWIQFINAVKQGDFKKR